MDKVRNPYAPGAGAQPRELVGRDEIREDARVALERVKLGLPNKSLLMIGLRGMGKTVLLDRIRSDAERSGVLTIRVEAVEEPKRRSLPALLAPELRGALLKLSRKEAAKSLAQRALRALAGFAKALKVKYQDIEVGLDFDPEPGLADNGDLDADLRTLLEAAGAAAKADRTCIALFLDELQYVKEDELSSLIMALHRAAQERLPIVMMGAGLHQVRGNLGKAKSYAERLFDFPIIDRLSPEDAKRAVAKPALDEGVAIEDEALGAIVARTQCYPYFLQEWGKHLWDVAERSPIGVGSVEPASQRAIAALDASFFMMRLDRLAPSEKKYLRAMASLGPGPCRSGDVAATLGRDAGSLNPTRGRLIKQGMIWSPAHGELGFTVPMFDEFMRRAIPNGDWR